MSYADRPGDADVTITHRAAGFALGRGPDYYGVFAAGETGAALLERFPRDAAGWYRAWAQFNRLATVGADDALAAAVGPDDAIPFAGISLLLGGIVLGIASLFPAYLSGSSLVSEGSELAQHVFFLAGWALVVALLASGGPRRRAGAAFGIGFSVMAFGFYLSDLAQVVASGAHAAGAGLVLALVGWLACSEGCVVAAHLLRRTRSPDRPVSPRWGLVLLASALAAGGAVSFAPSWDSFHLYAAATGQSTSFTAGDAFANPAPIIAANLVVMVGFVLLTALFTAWRPPLIGASLLVGAVLAMVSQIVVAFVQMTTPQNPAAFGFSRAAALRDRLQISAELTPVFYVFLAFLAGLVCFSIVRLGQGVGGRRRLRPAVVNVPVSR